MTAASIDGGFWNAFTTFRHVCTRWTKTRRSVHESKRSGGKHDCLTCGSMEEHFVRIGAAAMRNTYDCPTCGSMEERFVQSAEKNLCNHHKGMVENSPTSLHRACRISCEYDLHLY